MNRQSLFHTKTASRPNPIYRLSAILTLLCLLLTGCGWFQRNEVRSAVQLAYDGTEEFDGGNFQAAIKTFQTLKDWYPFSKYAILAELKIGDAHFQTGQYDEAIFAYEEFEKLHPLNEATPYVVFQIGQCYFKRVDTIDRDQSTAQLALDTFQRLIRQFPSDPYADQARAQSKKCLQSLAGHEYHIGLYYYRTKHFKAALHRFNTVITRYPDTGVHHLALQYLAKCESILKTDSKP